MPLFRNLSTTALLVLSLGAQALAGAQSRDPGIIVVDPPDAPTQEVRDALQRARGLGLQSVTIKIQNAQVILEPELMLLIFHELFGVVEEYGYSYNKITWIQCPETC